MPINVGQAVGYLDLDTTKFEKGIKQAEKELKNFSNSSVDFSKRVTSLGKSLTSIGTTLNKSVTLPIAALGTASAKASIDFESAFAGIRKTVDATESEFSQLRKGILAMTKEIPQTAVELSKIGEIAGQLGIKTENILGFTKTIAMLGDTTNIAGEQAASSLARIANITGMSQDNFDRLGSSIVELGNNFATTESEITEMALRLSSVGTLVGLSESQIIGLAATLSSVGLQAELGGSALSKLLIKMQLAVEEGGVALEQFANVANMTTEQFGKAFKEDATVALSAWLSGLQDVDRLGASTIKILTDVGIKEVRLRDTVARLSNASGMLSEAVSMSNDAWEQNTALVKEANKRYETTESQIKLLRNGLVELGIKIGDKLLPVLNKIVDDLRGMVDWFTKLDDSTIELITKFALLVAAIGPILTITGKLINAIALVITKIKGWSTVASLLKGVLSALSGPIGVVTLAVVGLTAGIVTLIKRTHELTDTQKDLVDTMKNSKKTYDDTIQTLEDEKVAMEGNILQATNLIDSMYDLGQSNEDAAIKVRALSEMQSQLEALIPGLKLEINKETGEIITQRSEVDKLIYSYIKLAAAKVYAEKNEAEAKRYAEQLQIKIKAVNELEKAENNLSEAEKKLNEISNKTKGQGLFVQLATGGGTAAEVKKYENQKKTMNKTIEEANKLMEESKTNMSNLSKEQAEFEKELAKSLGIETMQNDTLDDTNKTINKTINTVKDYNKVLETSEEEGAEAVEKFENDKVQSYKKAEDDKEKIAKESFEAEKERYDKLLKLTQDYYDDISSIEEEAEKEKRRISDEEKKQIDEINEEYERALESRKNAIRSAYGLFDEFVLDKENQLSGNQLLKNLKSQLKGIEEWKEDLDSLAEKGVASGLLDELKEMGPKAAGEIDQLNKLSDKKLQEYVDTWQKLNEEIASIAEEDLIPEREEADKKIKEVQEDSLLEWQKVNDEAIEKIDEIKSKYEEGIKDLGVVVSEDSKEAGIEIIDAIKLGVEETEDSLLDKLNELKDEISSIVRSIKRDISSVQTAAESIDGSHKDGLSYVPFDGYIAKLHEGERVLTKEEARDYNNKTGTNKQTLNVNFTGTFGQLIRAMNPQFKLEDNRGGEEY